MEIVSGWIFHGLILVIGALLGGTGTFWGLWRLGLLSWASRDHILLLKEDNERLVARATKAQDEYSSLIQHVFEGLSTNE